jgi:hypothetical protein
MVGDCIRGAKTQSRFAPPPWTEQSASWRQIDVQLPADHLAREIRDAIPRLDMTPLYASYAGRDKAAHRLD